MVAVTLSHFLLGLPIQFSDSFDNLTKLTASWPTMLAAEFTQHAFLRPGLWAELKLVHDASGGQYTPWFRSVQAGQAVLLVVLFLALIRPRTRLDALLVPLGLAVLVGMHTFLGTVREAFPINTFLTIVLLCFAAAVIALGRYRWWNDLLALACFVVAALTVESGLLVFVIIVTAALTGARGVSRVGVTLVALACAGYFVLRFMLLDVGTPGLLERSSGFGFSRLEPTDLMARFGDGPIGFYAYNVLASIGSVLFSEPSNGVFHFTRELLAGEVQPARVVYLVSSTAATALLVTYGAASVRRWRQRACTRDDQLWAMAVTVLAANAAISYPYTKDVVMSPAGAFYAVAVVVAARSLLGRVEALPDWKRVAVTALMIVLGTGWALRFVGLHLSLRVQAHVARSEWAYRDNAVREGTLKLDGRAVDLFRQLQGDALYRHPPPPPIALPLSRWMLTE